MDIVRQVQARVERVFEDEEIELAVAKRPALIINADATVVDQAVGELEVEELLYYKGGALREVIGGHANERVQGIVPPPFAVGKPFRVEDQKGGFALIEIDKVSVREETSSFHLTFFVRVLINCGDNVPAGRFDSVSQGPSERENFTIVIHICRALLGNPILGEDDFASIIIATRGGALHVDGAGLGALGEVSNKN